MRLLSVSFFAPKKSFGKEKAWRNKAEKHSYGRTKHTGHPFASTGSLCQSRYDKGQNEGKAKVFLWNGLYCTH